MWGCALQPLQPAPLFRMQWFQYGVLLERLQHREELRFGTAAGVLVDIDEVRASRTRSSTFSSPSTL